GWQAPPASSGRLSTTTGQRRSGRCGRNSCARPGQRLDEAAEDVAALLEIGELVEGRAGRRQQDHGARLALRQRRLARRGDGAPELAAAAQGHAPIECRGELLGRLADEEGVADARE